MANTYGREVLTEDDKNALLKLLPVALTHECNGSHA